jgi:uncharacterized protein
VFEHEGQHYAFDVRNYVILRLDLAGAAVLCRMRNLTLGAIEGELASQLGSAVVRAHYVRFLEMIRDGVFSVRPLSRPERPPFDHLVIMLAGGCNMGCSYCFEKHVPIYQNPNLMTRERADEVLAWFFRHHEGSRAHIQLYGGEPLLNWPVLVYVVEKVEAWAEQNRFELTKYLITNGTLLAADRIAFLKAHRVSVQVSVDGDAETHDRFRVLKSGKPTMERIRPNIDELVHQEADFNLRAVLTSGQLDPRVVTDGLLSHGAKKVSFEVVATDDEVASLSERDWHVFHEKFDAFLSNPYSTWEELPADVQTMIIRICQHEHVSYGCGAGVNEVTVSPDGSIYECQRIYRTPYSHISHDKSPTELNSKLLTMVDDRPICNTCWARYLCGGGCMHQSHVGHGSDDPLPHFCRMERRLVEAAIVKIGEIRSSGVDALRLEAEIERNDAALHAC